MKLHPRHEIVETAKREIAAAVSGAISEHDLTYAELLTVLTEVQQTWLRYMLRDERNLSPSGRNERAR